MPLRLRPDPGSAFLRELERVLERTGLAVPATGVSSGPWRRTALQEGVAREPGRPRPGVSGAYGAAVPLRRTPGATRA